MRRLISAAVVIAALAPQVRADGIADVEGARAHERQGSYLSRQEREKLRRYGGNDDGFYSSDYGEGYYNGYAPSVPIYGFTDPYSGYDDDYDED